MASKAQKLKHKRQSRGRPCKEGVPRTDGGRISRAQVANDAPDVLGRETRVRLHGVKKEDAAQPEAGTVIGRMKLKGDISPEQYEAFVRYSMTRERYMQAIAAPDSLKTKRGGVMHVPDDAPDISAVAAWDKLMKAISEAQKYERGNLMAALNFIVTRDEFHHHMVGDLRVVGNALCRHYGIDLMRKSA